MIALSNEEQPKTDRPYDANIDIWYSMAYVVGKILKIRPTTILYEWSCSELLVTFGIYMNDKMRDAYAQYQDLSPDAKRKVKQKPTLYALKFYTYSQFMEAYSRDPDAVVEVEAEVLDPMIEQFLKGGGAFNG